MRPVPWPTATSGNRCRPIGVAILYSTMHPMNILLLILGCLNLVVCFVVGVPLFFGMRRIGHLRDVEPWIGVGPPVSIIVAARNEGRHIRPAVEALLKLDYEPLEWLVVNDRSTDDTGKILDELALLHPKLKVVHLDHLPPGWLGKNHALHYGTQQASGELFLFTDADVVMEPTVLRRAVRHMQEHQIDHLPMLFAVKMPNWLLESFVVTFSIYLMSYCRPWACPNPNSSAHIGIGGFNLIRRSVYDAIGTLEAIRMRPDDDLKLGKLVKRHRFRQELLNASDQMYVPWYSSIRELVRGLEKNAFAGLDYNIAFTLFTIGMMLTFNVFPFIAIFVTTGTTWWIYLAVVICLWGLALISAYYGRARLSCAFGFPLAALAMAAIQLRTMIVNLWLGGIRWRDTHYPLAELKANRV